MWLLIIDFRAVSPRAAPRVFQSYVPGLARVVIVSSPTFSFMRSFGTEPSARASATIYVQIEKNAASKTNDKNTATDYSGLQPRHH